MVGEILTAGDLGRLPAYGSNAPTTARIPMFYPTTGKISYVTPDQIASGASAVDGPSSATDNAVALFDSTTGKIIKNSVVTVTSGAVAGVTTLTATGIGSFDGITATKYGAISSDQNVDNYGITVFSSTAQVVATMTSPTVGVMKWVRSGSTATTAHTLTCSDATIGASSTANTFTFAGIDDYVIIRGETTAKWGIYSKSTGVTLS